MASRQFCLLSCGALLLTIPVMAVPVWAETPSCRSIPASQDVLIAGRLVLLDESEAGAPATETESKVLWQFETGG